MKGQYKLKDDEIDIFYSKPGIVFTIKARNPDYVSGVYIRTDYKNQSINVKTGISYWHGTNDIGIQHDGF